MVNKLGVDQKKKSNCTHPLGTSLMAKKKLVLVQVKLDLSQFFKSLQSSLCKSWQNWDPRYSPTVHHWVPNLVWVPQIGSPNFLFHHWRKRAKWVTSNLKGIVTNLYSSNRSVTWLFVAVFSTYYYYYYYLFLLYKYQPFQHFFITLSNLLQYFPNFFTKFYFFLTPQKFIQINLI